MDTQEVAARPLALTLLPIMTAVFVVFLITGATLPALPLHISEKLGYGAFVVGLVAAAQFAASLLSRLWAGHFSDHRGPKGAVVVGLGMAALAGIFYLLSLVPLGNPALSVMVLLGGRALMGGAESFVITGAQSWSLKLAGPAASAKVIGWIGTAMYVALAGGAPIGSLLFGVFGFSAIGIATLVLAVLAATVVLPMRGIVAVPHDAGGLRAVLGAVALPGMGLAFASLAYGAMTAFSVLYFTEKGWQPAWLSFSAFAVALILARLLFGYVPDRHGGARTTMIFVMVQAVGMALTAFSPIALLGFTGAFVTGFGYAFVYPGLGREAVHWAPAGSHGMAMGIYTAFLDVALGILTPLLGLLADVAGLGAVFALSAVLAVGAVPVAMRLLASPARNT